MISKAKQAAPNSAFVWIWLPEATSPVVAGRIDRDGDIYGFTYGRSYLARKDAMPIYLPELPLQPGAIEPEPPLKMANSSAMPLRMPGDDASSSTG